MTARLVAPVTAISLLAVAGLGAVPVDTSLERACSLDRAYLADIIGLSDSQIRQIESGTALTTTLSGRAGQEVVTFGVVRIRRAADEVLRSLRSLAVSPLGIKDRLVPLNEPALPSDWSTLTLAPAALSNLNHCRPGHCSVQLPGPAIEQLRGVATNTAARQVVHDIVTAYQHAGHRSLQPYADRNPSTSASTEYERLLASHEYLPLPLTTVRSYLDQYPNGTQADVADDFFWSVQDFGMKPTLRVFHRSWRRPQRSPIRQATSAASSRRCRSSLHTTSPPHSSGTSLCATRKIRRRRLCIT